MGNNHTDTGKRLRDLRLSHGYTQAELASVLGLTRDTIASYESRGKLPSVSVLRALSDLYHVSSDYLLCRTDDPAYDSDIPVPDDLDFPTTSPEEDFADLFPAVSTDTSKLLFQTLKGCTEEEMQKAREIIELIRRK